MIKGLLTGMLYGSAAVASPAELATTYGSETYNEINHQVSSHIEVLSSYYGAIHKNQHGLFLNAEVSDNVQPGDMIVMIVATSGGDQNHIPSDFIPVINAIKHKGDLTLRIGYKFHEEGDDVFLRIRKKSRNFFVSLLTIRGATRIVDARGMINTASGSQGLAYTPKINTEEDGALISSYAYDDPHAVKVLGQDQKTLVSIANGDDGMAVAISKTDGGKSRRIKAIGQKPKKGGGDDIAIALALY